MKREHPMQWQFSENIRELRTSGDLESAISQCISATENFPQNDSFFKLLGDLYYQTGDYEKALNAYAEQLKCLRPDSSHFNTFARSYQRIKPVASDELLSKFRKDIATLMEDGDINTEVTKQLNVLFRNDLANNPDLKAFLEKTNDDKNLKSVRRTIDSKINNKDDSAALSAIEYRINAIDRSRSRETDQYFISLAERLEMFEKAQELISNNAEYLTKPMGIHTLLRICRKLNNYSLAEKLLKLDENLVAWSNFNVQYELVYYFDHIDDKELLEQTLQRMRQSAETSAPIARTLYNFYLRFNKFDEAMDISKQVDKLEAQGKSGKPSDEVIAKIETDQEIRSKLEGLVSDQEHSRQMIALRDLLKGFSHELGQPITNIRYAVQLHQMKLNHVASENETLELCDMILAQTKRIGDMLARFRPITSSKSKEELFNVSERISAVFDNLQTRLLEHNIGYKIEGNKKINLWGDAVLFDQVFYNLILNSIHAISVQRRSGHISVEITAERETELLISFYNDGPRIPEEISRQIFEPFFSTKEPSTENGDDGLGLFIVWNILKLFNGSIHLDKTCKKGARFIMEIQHQNMEGQSHE